MSGPVVGSVEREQLEAMIRATPWAWSLGVLGVFVAHGQLASGPLLESVQLWSGAMAAAVVVRLLLWAAWRRARPVPDRRWAAAILGTNLLFAAGWGALGLLLVGRPASPQAEGVLHVTLAAVAMGGTSRLAGFDRSMAAYVALALAPAAVRDLALGGGFHALLALLLPLIGMYALFSGRSTSHALRVIERQRRQLQEASAVQARFFAAANHDLRQPLHALGLLVQTLQHGAPGAESAALVDRMQDCTDGMTLVVDELMELASAEADLRDPQLRPLALDTLVQAGCRPFAALARAKGLELVLAVPPELGVLSDAALLTRLLGNLVSNAVRYTSRGTVTVSACAAPGGRVALMVEDTGVGIAEEHLPHVFEPFYQVGNPGRDRRLGLGLGLATVQRFAQRLDARVEVVSTPGAGSRFTLILAAAARPTDDDAREASSTAPARARVLVLEDDADARFAMRALLTSWGHVVDEAADGDDALRQLALRPAPQAVVSDLRLPGAMNGVDAVAALRARLGAALPALIVTGDAAGAQAEAARRAGLPVALKPLAPAHLRAFLGQALAADARPARKGS